MDKAIEIATSENKPLEVMHDGQSFWYSDDIENLDAENRSKEKQRLRCLIEQQEIKDKIQSFLKEYL
ncbi:MAG: hypothetical protein RQ783_03735, partial [Gammaproteobacteria bacterium]|nr:hypothetical protein [Gammaproteobacteria bacterium]